MSLRRHVEALLVRRDIRATTERFYLNVVGAFISWSGSDDAAKFTADAVSAMLRDKAREGRSPYYLRSARAVCRLLLKDMGKLGPIRSVRLPPLVRAGWQAEEIARLIAAGYRESQWWGSLIEAAYYSGLAQCDLLKLRGTEVSEAGWVRTTRRKTGAPVLVAVPPSLADYMRRSGNEVIWKWHKSLEWFRREFRRIARAASVPGSFKMLRAASGSAVEAEHPGAGHRHLANTPQVFERHYQTRAAARPTMPPEV